MSTFKLENFLPRQELKRQSAARWKKTGFDAVIQKSSEPQNQDCDPHLTRIHRSDLLEKNPESTEPQTVGSCDPAEVQLLTRPAANALHFRKQIHPKALLSFSGNNVRKM